MSLRERTRPCRCAYGRRGIWSFHAKRYDYRAKAEYCREMAAKVMSPLDKEEWLQLATN